MKGKKGERKKGKKGMKEERNEGNNGRKGRKKGRVEYVCKTEHATVGLVGLVIAMCIIARFFS